VRRLTIFLIFLLPVAAGGEEACFDFAQWRQAVVTGDEAAARGAIDAAVPACGCADENADCLQLPGSPRMIAPRDLRQATERLLSWRGELNVRCSALPNRTPDEQQARIACYRKNAKVFSEGLGGEPYAAVFSPLPEAIAMSLEPAIATDAPESAEEKNYSIEARVIGERLCVLNEKLFEAKDLLTRVQRQGGGSKHRVEREGELIELIEELTGSIAELKAKFQRLTGETYNAFDFCGPQSEH